MATLVTVLALGSCASSTDAGPTLEDVTSCQYASDCVLRNRYKRYASCGYNRSEVEAVNDFDAPYLRDPDPDKPPALCLPESPPPELVPVCEAGRCEVLDVLESPWTACREDADCVLRRYGCGCIDYRLEPYPDFTALSAEGAAQYESTMCAPTGPAESCLPAGDTGDPVCEGGRCRSPETYP